jgi:CRP-like cAMP-binding protein
MPGLAFDVAWLGSREEGHVDENLTSAGRRTATERTAALIVMLYKRANALGLVVEDSFLFPLTQQHIARSGCRWCSPTRRWRGCGAWACSRA